MKKTKTLSILLLALVLILTACGGGGDVTLKTVEGEGGLSYGIPEDWVADDANVSSMATFSYPDMDQAEIAVNYNATEIPGISDDEQMKDDMYNVILETLGGTNESTVEYNGMEFRKGTTTYPIADGVEMDIELYGLIENDYVHFFIIGAEPGYQGLEATTEAILNSVSVE